MARALALQSTTDIWFKITAIYSYSHLEVFSICLSFVFCTYFHQKQKQFFQLFSNHSNSVISTLSIGDCLTCSADGRH